MNDIYGVQIERTMDSDFGNSWAKWYVYTLDAGSTEECQAGVLLQCSVSKAMTNRGITMAENLRAAAQF